MISGGGTGGHIYPAIAIANEFRERHPHAEILFVGAEGRMEMTRVPQAGYKIVGLWISGLQRRLTFSNLLFPVKLVVSYVKAARLVKKFRPDVVVGTGGYASGPLMIAAARLGVPSILQEQNSVAGLTNRKLAPYASAICVAYPHMEKYFPGAKLVMTGNPVRKDIADLSGKKEKAVRHFGLQMGVPTLLVLGGSGGARAINHALRDSLDQIIASGAQLIWQTGKVYYEEVRHTTEGKDLSRVRIYDFIGEMDLAYAAADTVISRAGALAISELCLAGKATVLVPSSNVADDHQTRNAQVLEAAGAAEMVRDADTSAQLATRALQLLHDDGRRATLERNITTLARPNATQDIVQEIEKVIA